MVKFKYIIMGFNYLQTDDRDDYFYSKPKRVQKYAIKRADFFTDWISRNQFRHKIKQIIADESNFSWKELYKIPLKELIIIANNLGYEIKYEKLLESEFSAPWE